MNFENYRYFVVAAEELNFTQAAKKLFVTQQALSKQMDKMEKFYNARLFNREPPMSLTPAGECLYRHMCRLMDDERQMRRELDGLLNISNNILTVGVSYYRSSVLLPQILAAFHREHPEIQVRIMENNLSKTVEALKLGKVDLMFGYEQPKDQTLVSRRILEERVVFVLPRSLASEFFTHGQIKNMQEAGGVSLKDFAHCPFLRLSDYTWLGKHFDRCCAEEEVMPRIVLDSGSVLTVLNCCLEGMGAALVPEPYLKSLTKEQLGQFLLFPWDYPNACCNGAILYLKSSYMSEAAMDFIRTAQNVYPQNVQAKNAPKTAAAGPSLRLP